MALRRTLLALARVDLELPWRVCANDTEFPTARRQRFEIHDRRAGLDPGAVGFPLLLDGDGVDDVAEGARRRFASVSHGLLELVVRKSTEDPCLLRQILVDALRGQGGQNRGFGYPAFRGAPARIQPDCFLLCLAQQGRGFSPVAHRRPWRPPCHGCP